MKSRIMYVCGTAYCHDPDITLYDNIELLKKSKSCWKECGIVEISLAKIKYVEEPNLMGQR